MNQRKPRRIRRILKWAGVAACGLMLLLWVITFFWEFGYLGVRTAFTVGPGYFAIHFNGPFPMQKWFLIPTESTFCWWPIPHSNGRLLLIPFSLALLIAAIPTAILRRERAIPPGHCNQCGYKLTGNVSGVCPECGRAI